MNSIGLKAKIIMSIVMVGLICMGVSIFVASRKLSEDGKNSLIEKSHAVLSRLAVGAEYVAKMHTLDGIVDETTKNYSDGHVPKEQIEKILRNVPIYAAFQIGKQGAELEHYQFRVASQAPRNKENRATPQEDKDIERFKANPDLKEIIYESDDKKYVSVIVPVRIKEEQNCLVCHGNPSRSPWKNGNDILGYKMENMKDGDLRGTFAVISNLEPVKASVMASTRDILLYGTGAVLIAIFFAIFILKNSFRKLGEISESIHTVTTEIRQASESLASASQSLASSSQEQASSVEEVSASVEEISGLVAATVKGSHNSLKMSQKVSELVSSGTTSMTELQRSVNEIAEANSRVDKVAQLIEQISEKTQLIDEIVFQTKLLSFNASVEAERAGEHGRGFAVVAQEVGSLAQMSGESADEISQIVKGSIMEAKEVAKMNQSKVEQGVVFCKSTADQLQSIEEASKEILMSVEHALRSSEEQSTGIQQINQSIQLINKTTQKNAFSADECSKSSLVLTDQGVRLAKTVEDLEILIKGKK